MSADGRAVVRVGPRRVWQVQSLHLGVWSPEPQGDCDSAAEAEAALASLLALGEDWTEATTRVRLVSR